MVVYHSYDGLGIGGRNPALGRVHEKNKKRIKLGDKFYASIRDAAVVAKRSTTMVGKFAKHGKLLDGVPVRFATKEEWENHLSQS